MKFQKEFDRALAVHRQGKLREAFHRYDAILQSDGRHAPALHYSGVVLHQAGQHAAAADRIRAALAIDDTSADAWSNLALALEAAGRPAAAIDALKEALRRAPRAAEFAANLAAVQMSQGLLADAEASARQATTVDPRHPNAWYHLALALERQDRILEALDAAGRACGLMPGDVSYAGLKAQLELAIGAPERARATLEAALARSPTSATLRFEYASLLERLREPVAAAEAYRQAIRLDPGHGPALSQLVHLERWTADWRELAEHEQRMREGVAAGRALLSPFVMLAAPSTRAEQRRAAESWSGALAGAPLRARRPLSTGRLRVGYLSADFHTHATAFLTAGLFEAHDRGRFEIAAYSIGQDDASPMRQRLVRAFDRFVDLKAAAPEQVAARIRDDGIDLLVDLKGHTAGAPPRILALRPAPLQAHYLGYPGTIGGGLVDYLIGDAVVTPEAHAADYAETLVRLPGQLPGQRPRPPGCPAAVAGRARPAGRCRRAVQLQRDLEAAARVDGRMGGDSPPRSRRRDVAPRAPRH